MKRSQIQCAIAAMEAFAAEHGAMDVVSRIRASLGTFAVDPRDGSLYGTAVEFRARIERKTGKRYASLSADVQELYETHHAVTCATAHLAERLDDDGCPMGVDFAAHSEYVRCLAVAA